MKKSKFSERQIPDIHKKQDFGKSVAEISRAYGSVNIPVDIAPL